MTNLFLLNVPITDLKNQILFTNNTARETYFKSKRISEELTDFSYIEQKNLLKLPFAKEDVYNCNYIMYQNQNYSNKWFYCFVTDIKYENDGLCYLTLKEDVFQTWFQDVTIHPSFVEREHVSDDTIGTNTVDENLNVGEAIAIDKSVDNDYITSYIIISSNYNPYTDVRYSGAGQHQGYITGSQWFAFNMRTELTEISNFIHQCDVHAHADDIQEIFAVPNCLITSNMIGENHLVNNTEIGTNISSEKTVQKIYSSYTPKNNKCKCYPYQYLYVSNNSGTSKIFKYENFSTENCVFNKLQLATNGCSIKLVPQNYKSEFGLEESIMLRKISVVFMGFR